MQPILLKRTSTFFLKAVIVLLVIVVLVFCAIMATQIYYELQKGVPTFAAIFFMGIIALFLTPIPFFVALFQAFKLLQYIDRSDAFSESSIKALTIIKYSAVVMTALYMLCLPLAYIVAELDDAPGLIFISTGFAFAPLVVATFAAVLQKLIQSALDMKLEHDLTV